MTAPPPPTPPVDDTADDPMSEGVVLDPNPAELTAETATTDVASPQEALQTDPVPRAPEADGLAEDLVDPVEPGALAPLDAQEVADSAPEPDSPSDPADPSAATDPDAPGAPDSDAPGEAHEPLKPLVPAQDSGDMPAVSDLPTEPITVGRMIADALRRAGVRWAFTVPGESFLGLIDGLEAAGIHVVATRHEGAAAFMAEAHAQLTGRPAACLATRAVGAANLSIGIHTAYADSSPMFALIGQVELAARGREGFQEIDIVG
ncbi:MAG: thiamine pyrophosphate-binding protein, partial [Chloroflexota bacterium]